MQGYTDFKSKLQSVEDTVSRKVRDPYHKQGWVLHTHPGQLFLIQKV